jgi:hypothetical protein
MEKSPFIEKRNNPRFPVNLPVSCFNLNSNQPNKVQTHDISAEGLCLITDKEMPVGSWLEVFIHMLDKSEQLYRRGKVIWSNSIDNGIYRIGVRLEPPKLNSTNIVLRTIIAQRNY